MASTVDQNYEQLSYNAPGLAQHNAKAVGLVGDAVATRTLLPKDAGKLCQFDRAAGVVYTLPAPVLGMEFEFETTVTCTSNAHKVITNAGTVFIQGIIQSVIAGAATTLASQGNGTTHVSISSNGTTTGGVIGGRYKLTAVSATLWQASGFLSASGALATPYATS